MCFSATASFTVAAGTGLVGVLGLAKAPSWREIPLASIPLAFAAQQTVEGALWLALARGNAGAFTAILANSFAFFALAIWPAYVPLAAGLVERTNMRRSLILGLLVVAVPLSAYGATHIIAHPYTACIVQRSLSYTNGVPYAPLMLGAYIVCTCVPLILSSHKALQWFGGIVVTGLVVSTAFYVAAQFSVWCFFAAAGSVTVHLHFATSQARIART